MNILRLFVIYLCLQESLKVPSPSEIKEPTLEPQSQSRTTELAVDLKLQQKIKELSECLCKKENELSEMAAKLTEISKIKSQLDEVNAHVDALGKRSFTSLNLHVQVHET